MEELSGELPSPMRGRGSLQPPHAGGCNSHWCELAGDPITAVLTTAPGNDASIGGLKVCPANVWFAARPSGTEDVYKVYAESFTGADHLAQVQQAAQELVARVL